MKSYLAIIIVTLAALLTSCRTPCPALQVKEVHDTITNTAVNTIREIVYVPDTVLIEIPHQTATIVTKDTTSHLENDYALSDACINPDGTLFHSLETKAQKIEAPFQKPVEKNTTTSTSEKTIIQIKEVEIPVEVEKKLSYWQSFKLSAFWYLFAYGLALSIILVWSKRKTISSKFSALMKFVRRFI